MKDKLLRKYRRRIEKLERENMNLKRRLNGIEDVFAACYYDVPDGIRNEINRYINIDDLELDLDS